MSLAVSGIGTDRFTHIGKRTCYRVANLQSLCDPGRDSGRRGASRAVRVWRIDASGLEYLHKLAAFEQKVGHSFAGEMSPLHEHGPRAKCRKGAPGLAVCRVEHSCHTLRPR